MTLFLFVSTSRSKLSEIKTGKLENKVPKEKEKGFRTYWRGEGGEGAEPRAPRSVPRPRALPGRLAAATVLPPRAFLFLTHVMSSRDCGVTCLLLAKLLERQGGVFSLCIS